VINCFLIGNLREFRTVVAFLLERPNLLTTVGMLELVSSIIKISRAIDLSGPTLKTHFTNILHTYSPVLCHIVVVIYTQFMGSLDGEDGTILKRLIALARDDSQSLPFRLLGVHWLQGIGALHLRHQNLSIMAPYASQLYPLVFDPLSLKAAKLGALAHCAVELDQQEGAPEGNLTIRRGSLDPPSVLLNKGLLSVSSYHLLPPWSTETLLAFHIFHRFLTVTISHSAGSKVHTAYQTDFRKSVLFETLQDIFVTLAAKMWKLVPNIVALLDRLMGCSTHRPLAEWLLQVFNEKLLIQLQSSRQLSSYFPLLERIAEYGEIPPGALVDKLTVYTRQRVEEDEHDDEERTLWSRGIQVLGICRTILVHNQSSRVFHILTPLLGFLCRFFPDIEVRDTARYILFLSYC
jgi:AP-5 complex subunit beta-1